MSGLRVLFWTFARRDRWFVLWFVIGITVLYWSQAVSVDGLYTTREAFEDAAKLMGSNPAFVAMAGPARALDTTGGQVAWQASAFGAVVAGLMSMFLVGRHTRAEEESGRDELLRAGAVSRRTPMLTACLVVLTANVLVGAGVTLSLILYGLAVSGAVVLGVGLCMTGLAFGAVALLAAQLSTGTRAAYGITGAFIGIAYALRAIGDLTNGALSWLSPIGWYQSMHAYSGERWWPLLLLIAFAAVTLITATVAFDRRDFAAGLWPTRPGPERAGPGLRSALGLSWRLQRGSLVGWTVGLFVGGVAYGSIGDDVKSLIGDSGASKDLFIGGAGDLVDNFYATAAVMMALISSGFAVSSALHPRSEEDAGRLEVLVATAMPRQRWWLGNVLITVLGSVMVVSASGIGMGIGFGLATGDLARFHDLVLATWVMVPGVVVLSGVAWVLVGLTPRRAALTWLALAFCAVVLFFGSILRLPQWLLDLSPFTHLGRYPAQPIPWGQVGLVLGFGAILGMVALSAFRRRDLLTG